MSIMCKN